MLPLKARLLTFNSLVQSHLNYCSLVWGSSPKSKIESLFAAQKKAMRAVMSGWVNYYYKDGTCPSHTKSSFTDQNILTVHNVILKNIMIFINKIHNFSHLLPISVTQIISPDSPSLTSPTDNSSDWYSKYNSPPYNNSTFFKGPLLYANIMTENTELDNTTIKSYKKSIKTHLLQVQSSGDSQEWNCSNFKLFNLPGLRSSERVKTKQNKNAS